MSTKMRSFVLFLAGAASCGTWFIACGDGHGSADAATCDCPAAEPPLNGRIMVVQGTPASVPANSAAGATVDCPVGAQLLTGGCINVDNDAQTFLMQSYATDTRTWACTYSNRRPDTQAVMVRATVTCLMPAQ